MLTFKTEKQLKNLGLNSYEVKIWTALLSRGTSTAGELSDIANVPRSRSYDVLESLEKKGFVMMKSGKPIRYVAVPPKEVIEKVKKNIKQNAEKETLELSRLRNTAIIDELSSLHTQGVDMVDSVDLSGSLRGRQNLYNHMEYMIGKAEKMVCISTTEEELVRLAENFKPLFQKLKNKNIQVKIFSKLTNKTKKQVEDLKKVVEVRNSKNDARFCVVDNKEIMFMVMNDSEVHPSYDIGIWANTPLAETIQNFYSR